MATWQEIAAEVNALTELEVNKLNAHLDNPIGIVVANSDSDLEELAEDIKGLSNADHDSMVADIDTSGTKKGSRRPC